MVDASKLHDEAPSPFAPKTFTPTSGSVNQKTATEVQKVLNTVHKISAKEPENVPKPQGGSLFGGLSTSSTTTTGTASGTSGTGGATGLFGSVSSGSEKSGLFQVKKDPVTKTQSIASNASSSGFNFDIPKKESQAEIPKPSLFGSSAAPSVGSGSSGIIVAKKLEAKEAEKAPEKKPSIFGSTKPGGTTGEIFGSFAPSCGSIDEWRRRRLFEGRVKIISFLWLKIQMPNSAIT